MKLASAILVLITALVISVIAGYISVLGMSALFASGGVTVILMMASLEFGKLVASGWLKFNWSNPNVNTLHKIYLTTAVGVLLLITSIGVFGFLSAAHLEQAAPLEGLTVQEQQFQIQLDQKNAQNQQLTAREAQIDANISAFLKNDQASKGLRASNSLKAERDSIQKQIDANNAVINQLNEKLIPLKLQSGKVEAKLGPVKYVAAFIGQSDTDAAVRYVILTLMFAFDPLAVMLMLSGLITLNEWYTERKPESEFVEPNLPLPLPPVDQPENWADDHWHYQPEPEPEPEQFEGESSHIPYHAHELGFDFPQIERVKQPVAEAEVLPELEPEPETQMISDEEDRANLLVELEGILNEIEGSQDAPTRRERIIDMMEQQPEIVDELLQVAKELEDQKKGWLD